MGRFFTRFSDLLTPSERERMAELKQNGIPQHVRNRVNHHADEYWQNFELANYVAAYICLDKSFERQQEVTALLETNQKKSRRKKLLFRALTILFWCAVFYAVFKIAIWQAWRLF